MLLNWEQRALKAERALQLARSAISYSGMRVKVLAVLGNAKPDQWMHLETLARRLATDTVTAIRWLRVLEEAGWVEMNYADGVPQRGALTEWRLGYLVVVPDVEGIEV